MLIWGFAWAPAGFALGALGAAGLPLGLAPTHALALGFAASLLVAMVTRVSHGHSGRPLAMVPLAWLAQLELRERSGGEQFQAGLGRPPRSLKKQFQAANLAAWERGGPLVFSGGQLVFVPGLGLDTRVIGLPGQAQVMLSWVPLPLR